MNLRLVECSSEYWEFVRLLRNDPEVSDGFVEDVIITEEMQNRYMNKYQDCYRISLFDNKPVGYIGVINDDIRVCTLPGYQGKGIGKFMVNAINEIWPNAIAKVKVSNLASKKLFEACGYKVSYYLMTK